MPPIPWTKRHWSAAICFMLAVVTFVLYWPTVHHNFINFDDPDYIVTNSHVNSGLNWPNVAWAFTSVHADFWIPLTWISHMVDCQCFGLNAGAHHLVNVAFHIANSLLLFLWLNQSTGARWRSAFVAALFAWHPLRIESVAWAAERKDVLSAFFWLLALMAYTRYVGASESQRPKAKSFYALALVMFACGLMSKPMVVTLPFVLLLLDYWPLRRFEAEGSRFKVQKLIWEKVPFFALALASCMMMLITPRSGLWSTASLPFSARVANTLISYVRYLAKSFWPTDLALIYPYPHSWPMTSVAAAAVLLLAVSVFCFWWARRFPYLPVGWFWFLGVLVPVIGLTQAGVQAMADRFTYLPSIGGLIVVAWGANDLLRLTEHSQRMAVLLGTTALGCCVVATSLQLRYWQNSVTLFTRTIAVTKDNYLAYNCLGNTLEKFGRKAEAQALYTESVRVEPDFALGQFNLGMILLGENRPGEASNYLARAVQLTPQDAMMQYDFGVFLLQQGKPEEASIHFKAALANQPEFPQAQRQLEIISDRTNAPANRSKP